VLLPHLTKTFHKSRQALISEGEFYLKCIAGLLLSCAIVIGFYSSWIITFTFGEEYRLAGLALTIVTPTLALRGIGYLFDLSLIAGGKQMILALSAAIAFTSKLILELLLIPKYSYLGASWGTLIADTIAFIAGYFFVRNYVVKYNLIRFLYKPLLVGAIVTFLLWCLKCPPLLGIPLGISSYLILLFLFGTFTREEGENILFLIKGYWLRMRGKVQNLEV
jgi:O-antigen/teichoic acid export membrane protein